MLTSAPQSPSPKTSRLSTGLGHAYATLGLRAREARIDAIRQAALRSAQKVQEIADGDTERDELLAEVALCTYRLLDPRKRVRSIERIQLCILSERSLEMQAQSRKPLVLSQPGRFSSMLQSA
jgi:hypothetical protein